MDSPERVDILSPDIGESQATAEYLATQMLTGMKYFFTLDGLLLTIMLAIKIYSSSLECKELSERYLYYRNTTSVTLAEVGE